MSDNIHEPIIETTNPGEEHYQYMRKKFLQVIIGGGIFIALSITSIFIQEDYWNALIFTIVLTIIVVWMAKLVYPDKSLKKLHTTHFEFDENGIYEEFINPDTGDVEHQLSIPFTSMNRILIGNFVEEHEAHYKYFSRKYYKFNAEMVIEHEDGRFLHTFEHKEEFENWLPRFLDKNCTVVKTEYDLAPAYDEAIMELKDIDFSEITGELWQVDTIHPPIGEKSRKNPYVPWEPGNENQTDSIEKYQQREKAKTIKVTRKWERLTLSVLVVMSIVIGGFIFPFTPIEENGAFTPTFTIISFMALMLLLPICIVFWRPHTRWYLPILYCFVTTVVGTGFFLLASLMIDTAMTYIRSSQFFIFITVIGWIPAFVLFKIISGSKKLMQKL